MSVVVTLTSEVRAEPGDNLTAEVIQPWLAALPPSAVITSINVYRGHQRDEYTVLVGLKASWTEERGTGALL